MKWEADDKGNYICGDYVLTKVNNAFNHKVSYWISKKDYAKAFYCFTYWNEEDFQEKLKDPSGWISYFEEMLNDNGIKELEDDDICKCCWCEEEYEYSELKRTDMGLLCNSCIAAIRSRGEKLTVIEE